MNFELAVDIILMVEGGYSNNPKDKGGETNFGISKRSYPKLNIRALTRDEAKAIYKKDYWDRCQIDLLPEKIRLIVFDAAVNHGPTAACMFLQSVARTDQDGMLGRITLSVINQMQPEQILRLYADQRIKSYIKNPGFQHFGLGWLSRVMNIVIDSMI